MRKCHSYRKLLYNFVLQLFVLVVLAGCGASSIIDADGDSIDNDADNCPLIANTDQEDLDSDNLGDVCDNDDDADGVADTADNCPIAANSDQADLDSDGTGDVCDNDADGDSIKNSSDNCPLAANSDQIDTDADNIGDACDLLTDSDNDTIADDLDNCPNDANTDQEDLDSDNLGDVCDNDDDDDGVADTADNCPIAANSDQADLDSDGTGDVCDIDADGDSIKNSSDNCPLAANSDQEDLDLDGTGDACDTDDDGDGVADMADNCPIAANPDQTDTDSDGIGDVCDTTPNGSSGNTLINVQINSGADDAEEFSTGEVRLLSTDLEFSTDQDNAEVQTTGMRFNGVAIPAGVSISNAWIQFQVDETNSQSAQLTIRGEKTANALAFINSDYNLSGRTMTTAAIAWSPAAWDSVGANGPDQRTPNIKSILQEIVLQPGWQTGNSLSILITGSGTRTAESYNGEATGAPVLHVEYSSADPGLDTDGDGVFDILDNCINNANPDQADLDSDGAGDACDPDDDGDGIDDTADNCPLTENPGQADLDNDGAGDDCDNDMDGDGINNGSDNCPVIANPDQTDSDNDGIGDACPTVNITFAAIGDYGMTNASSIGVANLVKSWSPDFIITMGDNNYDYGEASTIDENIGQFYHEFINNYTGNYGEGSPDARFFPTLGNHDVETENGQPHFDYFTLPGNERYYDFVKGNVHFFALNSNSSEPDGRNIGSTQYQWLQAAVAQSTSAFKVVYFHHAAYSSGAHGNTEVMQWPLEELGIDAVFQGHDHTYERIIRDDDSNGQSIAYFVSGNGGRSLYSFGQPVPGSEARYNSNHGAVKVTATANTMTFEAYNIANELVDTYSINAQ